MSRIRTSDAARSLGMHPVEFILRLHEMVGSWGEVWPEVDSGYVETLRVMLKVPAGPSARATARLVATAAGNDGSPHGVSEIAARVIEKMWRKDRWGDMGVSWETVNVHMMPGCGELASVLEGLERDGLLLAKGRKGPFSLNPARKGDIEAIAQWSIRQTQSE